MPSTRVLPTHADFLSAWESALRGEVGPERNARRGGDYDLVAGPSALLWAQQSRRDRDNFRQCFAETATADALDRIVLRRYSAERVEESFGEGKVVLSRPTAAAGADIVYAGTRIEALSGKPSPDVYAVSADTDVEASALVVDVPIRATRPSAGVALSTSSGLRLADSVYDATFEPIFLLCADGTEEEKDASLLARGRAAKLDQRVGTQTAIERVCKAGGAFYVVVLPPDVFGAERDFGVTHVYVADAGYASTQALVDACLLALENARVMGCDAQVLGMAATPIALSLTVALWDLPGKFDLVVLRSRLVAALLDSFVRRPDFWIFSADELEAAAFAAVSPAAQSVAVVSTPSAPTPAFFPVLPRYTLSGSSISIAFSGPS